MTETFCPMPWITQSTRNNGDLRICCQANVGEDQGLIRKTVPGKPFYYYVRTIVKYNPDPALYIKNRLAGKQTTNMSTDSFHNGRSMIKNAWVSKTALFRVTYYDDTLPEHMVSEMLFTTLDHAEAYHTITAEQQKVFNESDYEFETEITMRTFEDTEEWVSKIRERYKAKDKIIEESRLTLTYFDQWDFHNVGDVYNAQDANLNEARNNPMMKQARLDMLEGKWPEACTRCKNEEAADIRSRMRYENERWSTGQKYSVFNKEIAKEITASDGSIDTTAIPTRLYDLRFGNLCNLKCRMCGPTDSSMWYEDQVKMFGESYQDTRGLVKLTKDKKGKYKPVDDIYGWYEKSSIWGQLEDNMPNIEHLHMVGGEPLMINQQYELLQKCIDRGEAHHIIIEHNSNITNIPDRAWNIWKHFKEIQIGASIDGVKSVVEYIRHPIKWSIIERNIQALDTAEGNYKLWFAPTIGILNARHFPDMIIWVLEQKFNRFNVETWKPPVTAHPLHHPKWLNMKILPLEAKKEITQYYEDCKPHIQDLIFQKTDRGPDQKKRLYNRTVALLDQYSTLMNQEDWSDLMPKFWELNSKLDDIRDEKLQDAIPDIYELIKHTRPE
jgi:organic radical activating enzyme